MGTKDEFEESTRIHASSELDVMLRKSRSRSQTDEFGGERTQVGKLDELVAKSKAMGEEEAARPASTNVVRRASSPVVARPSASGSQADVLAAPREGHKDDAAFEESDSKRVVLPLPAPPQSIPLPVPVAARLPDAPKPSRVRWGVIAWFVLLAAMIGVASVGYMRIVQLEEELAVAKAKLGH